MKTSTVRFTAYLQFVTLVMMIAHEPYVDPFGRQGICICTLKRPLQCITFFQKKKTVQLCRELQIYYNFKKDTKMSLVNLSKVVCCPIMDKIKGFKMVYFQQCCSMKETHLTAQEICVRIQKDFSCRMLVQYVDYLKICFCYLGISSTAVLGLIALFMLLFIFTMLHVLTKYL